MSNKTKVAFICVHNSCRSQMAEAIAKVLASDALDVYSAGTETKGAINPDAVLTIKELYGVDMTETQKTKLLSEIPPVDMAVTMGCNVACPTLPCQHREDWGLDDPTGKGRMAFIHTAELIEEKVLELRDRLGYQNTCL